MNPVPGSSNAHNLAYERSSTSHFSFWAQSSSRKSVISMSDTYSNASFSYDTNTRTPRYVKPSISRRQTRAPSPEPEEPPLSLGSPTQPRYVRPSLLRLASSASSPQRLDSPSMMNSRTGSSNTHNSSCERTLTSPFSSRSHSPSQ